MKRKHRDKMKWFRHAVMTDFRCIRCGEELLPGGEWLMIGERHEHIDCIHRPPIEWERWGEIIRAEAYENMRIMGTFCEYGEVQVFDELGRSK